MGDKIRLGICGYGNLGKGVQKAIEKAKDMELEVVFTRRDKKDSLMCLHVIWRK